MHRALLASLLAALPFVVVLPAQEQRGGPDVDRRSFTVVVHADDQPALAAVSIAYSAPAWQQSYDDMLASLKGSNYSRLGKDWWTTFDTIGALEISGIRIEAGSYYLGLRVDDGGAFSLLLFDSRRAMQERLLPAATPLYTGAAKADLTVPLTFARNTRKELAAKLEIEIVKDAKTPTQGTFVIRWGRHEATASLRFELGPIEGGRGKK